MNKYYSYPNIDLWKTENWTDKVAPLSHLIEYMQEISTIEPSDYVPSYEFTEGRLHEHPLFREKTHGIDDPAVVKEINDMGLVYNCTGQGWKLVDDPHRGKVKFERCWFLTAPQEAVENWTKLPTYIAFDCEDEFDPRWTMRAVKRFWDLIELQAKKRDFIIAVLVSETPVYDKIYFNIMQEFSVLYPCDIEHFYLDVSKALEKGPLKNVPGFVWEDSNGTAGDPDQAIEYFSDFQLPVLNITGRWGNGDSLERGLVVTFQMNEGRFDREWLIHSEVGKRMAQDMLYEYKYNTVLDPALRKEMEEKGFIFEIKYNRFGDRYLMLLPRQAVEEKKQLPLVLILQEVYGGNEHLAISAFSYCGEWLEIAAQGECALMIYVLEDIESNDRAVEMVRQEAGNYPIDLSRVYVTGHSHDGYFTYAFVNRNPDFVTAIAVLGMGVCPAGMNAAPDYSAVHNIANYDIPLVNIMGLCESNFPVDEEDKKTRWVDTWKQVFRNFHIPNKTTEDILAAFESEDYTQRTTCLAGDRFQTLWADGVEHYIVDFMNEEGKNHLRVIRQQNMPHTITPFMCNLSWDFLRRFRRDPETKKIVELY
ncbi:MAG: hypothetical protein LIP11_01425 [Clostridiales bacterium]|nr:hypothetical protein [Clostridiales bacterium]